MIENFSKYNFPTFGYIKIPKVEVHEKDLLDLGLKPGASSTEIITAITRKGFKEKELSGLIPKENRQIYIDQIKEELKTFDNLGFSDYVLIVYDIINYNRKHGRINSPARGSCGGSCVFYCMDIIKIDPIKYNLLFSRFLSSARASFKEINGEIYLESANLCDVDIDLENTFKDNVKQYLNEKYPNRTALISTLSTFSGKILLKEILKAYEGVNEDISKEASDLIDKKFGKVDSFDESMLNNDKFIKWSAAHSKTIELCKKLEDLNKNKSVHASATLLTYDIVSDVIPLELSSDKRIVTSYDMNYAQMIGIKLDLLGLRTLDVVNGCLKLINKKITDINIDDESIYNYLKIREQYHGLFQIEEGIGKQTILKVKPDNINELALCIALGRPGCMNFIDDYVAFKKGEKVINIDDRLKDILKPTAGIIVFQEQLMQLSMRMGGFTDKEADKICKVVGKKLVKEMPIWKEKFIEGSIKNGYTKEFAEETWKSFEASANYSFNRCLSPDTIVENENGDLVPMYEIKIGDKILAYDIRNHRDHFVEVKNIFSNNVELYEIELEDGRTIEASLNHKFLCSDNKMHKLIDIIDNKLEIITFEIQAQRIVNVKKIGLKNALDFEVNHPDHNFYANGIVSSNSHACGYANLTAITTYLKANYPKEFFVSLLEMTREEQKPLEEISKIQSELGYFDIKLYIPSLAYSGFNFEIDGKNIRYGLRSIRGVSEKTIEKFANFRKKYQNKCELFISAKQAKISIGILSALIAAGCLDDFIGKYSRSRLILEAQLFNVLSEKERKLCLDIGQEFQYNLFDIIKHLLSTKKIKESRFETIKKHYAPFKKIYEQNSKNEKFTRYYYENWAIGFSYSYTLKQIFESFAPNIVNINEVISSLENESVEFVANVKEVRVGTAKNEKKTKYMKVVCSDETGQITALLFNDKIKDHEKENAQKCSENNIVFIRGKKKGDSVFADKITIQDNKIFMKFSELKDENEV